MRNMSGKIRAIFEGLGLDPEDIVNLAEEDVGQEDAYRIASPFPVSGRYRRYISFMDDLTSLKGFPHQPVREIIKIRT